MFVLKTHTQNLQSETVSLETFHTFLRTVMQLYRDSLTCTAWGNTQHSNTEA